MVASNQCQTNAQNPFSKYARHVKSKQGGNYLFVFLKKKLSNWKKSKRGPLSIFAVFLIKTAKILRGPFLIELGWVGLVGFCRILMCRANIL
jgi:hypothetical protein